MEDECFICVDYASNRYTVVLDQSRRLEKKVLCDDCATELDREEWIELNKMPAVPLGGED